MEPLQKSLSDGSAYVRKTAVMGALKVHRLSPEAIAEQGIVDTLYDMIKDSDTQVL